MQRGTLPCSALTFVKNGGPDFEECLKTNLLCKEHIVLDGGSTDGTKELAERYGCTVITQASEHLTPDGRIKDFGGITNQGIAATSYPWVLIVSADEYIDEALQQGVIDAVEQNQPGVYRFNRKYMLSGKLIEYATNYPNYQIRLFHKDAIYGFIKTIHERPHVKESVEIQLLPGIQYTPLSMPKNLQQKHRYYAQLEVRAMPKVTYGLWAKVSWYKCLVVGYRVLKALQIRLQHPKGAYLPFAYEWLNIRYGLVLMWAMFPPVAKKLRQQPL